MAGAMRFGRAGAKRGSLSLGFCAKISMVVFLGLSFVVLWSAFSSSSSSNVVSQRSSFADLSDPIPSPVIARGTEKRKTKEPKSQLSTTNATTSSDGVGNGGEGKGNKEKEEEKSDAKEIEERVDTQNATSKVDEPQEQESEKGGDGGKVEGSEEASDEGEASDGGDGDLEDGVDVNPTEDSEGEENGESDMKRNKKRKKLGPLFDPNARYHWKPCGGSGWQNYIPCVDTENLGSAKLQSHRHHERSCPKMPVTCLVPLPQGYEPPVPWPERKAKILYRNLAHPKLSAFVKTRSWLNMSGDYLLFLRGESELKGGAYHYLDSIVEMVPDIEWGKNIRVVLDIGVTDASFGATLLEKDVLTLSLGLMNDETDLAQVALERGIPAVVGNLGTKRLPFPIGVFDAIHCSECNIPWHSSGGRLLIEMNRILRPGGYFILSTKRGDIESEEGMSTWGASICWNILAHKTDEVSEVGVKIYQRPASNDIYELRGRNGPPLCKEDDNQDFSWYTPIKSCLNKVPVAVEQRGSDWPEEWPKRLETFPEWLVDSQEKLMSDSEHWKAIITNSYRNGMGIDWSNVRNIMDMKAIHGGFAAALIPQNVWVMNVVPVHAPNTLPIIYERGLVGIYHDWCEPFSTYPRSYDLLHADHLFSRLKNRCKQPIVIVVEMDRILRPGGWVIIRDKLEILNPLESIFKSMHWDIRMTYGKDREGIICVQKTAWRP